MDEYTFISYTHENTRFALKLAHKLKRRGVPLRIDQWDIAPDQEWDQAIEPMVRYCDHFLVILSPSSVNSWVVQEQFSWAIETGRPMVTILHQACEIPASLQAAPCIDFTTQNFRSAFNELMAYYFPPKQSESKPLLWLQTMGANTTQFWYDTLLPLLWPGWLGPLLLLLLLLVGVMGLWRYQLSGTTLAEPRYEQLAIVHPTPTPLPPPIETTVRSQDGQVMVQIPAGQFLMGSVDTDPDASDDEKPQRVIHLDTFWIDQTEVTYAQYQTCVEMGNCSAARSMASTFRKADFPVIGVNWQQAQAYCQWVGGRLPTEAEWEKAARGMDARRYPWGNEFDGTRLNYCDSNCVADSRDNSADDGYRYIAPVGSYPTGTSPYGVFDMSGNVWEWTADWYAIDSYKNLSAQNPGGPESGLQRVVRGGSWAYQGRALRTAERHRDVPTSQHDNMGFRCMLPETEQGDEQAN